MRISTSQFNQQGIDGILDAQADLAKSQLQLSTGKRLVTPSDDPPGAAQVLGLNQSLDVTAQYQKNAEAAKTRLNQEEGALIGVGNVLNRVRELAIQANNATQSDETRLSIAQELRLRLDELAGLANSKDSNSRYLFAGFQEQIQPFTRNSNGAFDYNGDEGQRFVQISGTRQVATSDSGSDLFRAIPNGNGDFAVYDDPSNQGSGIIDPGSVVDPTLYDGDTYQLIFAGTPGNLTYQVIDSQSNVETSGAYVENSSINFNGISTSIKGMPLPTDRFTISPSVKQDMFATVSNLINTLETGTAGSGTGTARLNNSINRTLMDLDQSLGNVENVRAKVGARLSAIDSQQNLNEDFTLVIESAKSQIQDLDFIEAISRFNMQRVALESAQRAYTQVQGLNLFSMLR